MSVQRAACAALAERSRFFCGLVALIILAGFSISCGSSSSSSNASQVGYISIPNQGLIAMVRVNNSTGAITIGTKTPSVEGTGPTGLALNPSGKFLYAGDVRHHKITTFNVAADGSLTQSATDTPAGTDPSVMVVDPSGKYLLVTNPLDHNVSVFSIDSATGALNHIVTAV